MKLFLLALLLLSGCGHIAHPIYASTGKELAQCYTEMFAGFCVVNTQAGQVVVGSTQGVVNGVGTAIGSVSNATIDAAIAGALK